ncbi:MAG: hypothetical protein GY775_17140 [Candidatus Scalindua sp.]|nr:hypothetical protein [Candidatus Scalindua sp.]
MKTKKCAVTGLRFPLTDFYNNARTNDGLHPYAKHVDNFRRTNNYSTEELRRVFQTLKNQ